MKNKISICKVPFHPLTTDEVLDAISGYVQGNGQHFIVTSNPEFVIEAQKNPLFTEVLNKADISTADGIGILWASTFLYHMRTFAWKMVAILALPFQLLGSLLAVILYRPYIRHIIPERVTGASLFLDIAQVAAKKGWRVFLLGAGEGVAEQAQKKLQKMYPQLQVVGAYAGSPKEEDEQEVIQKINNVSPDILFVAYGAPKQELWIHRNLFEIPSVKMAMGIGGAFDMVAGVVKRAPKFMRSLGLEWLWRLFRQPTRAGRIFNATIRFIWLVVKEKLRHNKSS